MHISKNLEKNSVSLHLCRKQTALLRNNHPLGSRMAHCGGTQLGRVRVVHNYLNSLSNVPHVPPCHNLHVEYKKSCCACYDGYVATYRIDRGPLSLPSVTRMHQHQHTDAEKKGKTNPSVCYCNEELLLRQKKIPLSSTRVRIVHMEDSECNTIYTRKKIPRSDHSQAQP